MKLLYNSSKLLIAGIATFLLAPQAFSARVAMRIGSDPTILAQYENNRLSYPISKASMDYLHFDGSVTQVKNDLFATNRALIEVGMYTNGGSYTGAEVVSRIRGYEAGGMMFMEFSYIGKTG